MTKEELKQAVTLAKSDKSLINEDISIFEGYGLPNFGMVHATTEQLAALIRWQCLQFDGSIDATELDNLVKVGKKHFTIVG